MIKNIKFIEKALFRISNGELHNSAPKVISDAEGLLHALGTFEFKFLLCFWQKVLTDSHVLSAYFQQSSIDLATAVNLIDNFSINITGLRSEQKFEEIKLKAKEMANDCETARPLKKGELKERNGFSMS